MARIACALFFLFSLFPYTQLVSLPTYNQPYAIVMAGIILIGLPSVFMTLPQMERIMLGYLAVLGVVLFFFAAFQGLQFREVSYLISYLTPVITTSVCYWVMLRCKQMAVQLLVISICIWTSVGLIQVLGFPDFMVSFASSSEDLGSDIVSSGRGALSLAPEPTHFGFHMLLLGTALYLLRGPLWVVALAMAAILLLAKSSSAMLTIVLGLLVWGCFRPLWFCILAASLGSLAFLATIMNVFDENYRITSIILTVYESGGAIFFLDYSINVRLSGIFASAYVFVDRMMFPLGMRLEDWFVVRDQMLEQFRWIMNLSTSGPASGIGLIMLQGGFFAVPVVLYIMKRFIFTLLRKPEGILTAACFFVFVSQFYLASPTFGLVLAALIIRNQESKSKM